ncbi:MAG: 23S rRNA (uracil(1939)-C(5))-methyltransferase RlmD [Candidatus Gallionella acididurans]|uniref:23S rRNA (uracil(1939)-C(5))-methyltransferase RlmD n=1 Tax=Candidatus Gallionella acididurans TaxID=1796491 RepID=A0A139BY30_9PROT|nr:MAG: 23S rRNA (uracil(1939)-C(5))-methyltransferase RlmD [Candidatus Gallionella acididurans]
MSKNNPQQDSVIVESLDQEGRGVARTEGKVIFIEGALTGEVVSYSSYRKKPSFEQAQVTAIHKSSAMRVQPKCKHFGVCGGCSMQHLDARAQVAVKQRILEDSLWHIGKVRAETILRPIYGQTWGYRERARLSVRHVIKKGKTLVGFHEKRSSFVADMQHCEILTPRIAVLLPLLAELISGLSIRDRVPQIEVAVGDHVDVLVLRVMDTPSSEDESALRAFADMHEIQFWLQSKGYDTIAPFHPLNAPPLSYSLPEFGITMPFAPSEFTQVNSALNRVMISRAMRLLDPQPGERIADFFCGLGNFTLPIARSGAQVLGIEGSETLVARARQNAELNGLAGNAKFAAMNLFAITAETFFSLGRFDKLLIDPPRDGAIELVKSLGGEFAPRRIVYVSCNPGTLARDAAELVQRGYVLKSAGVMNMFPHTSHVESIAVFERP